jgi:hypothetical protein
VSPFSSENGRNTSYCICPFRWKGRKQICDTKRGDRFFLEFLRNEKTAQSLAVFWNVEKTVCELRKLLQQFLERANEAEPQFCQDMPKDFYRNRWSISRDFHKIVMRQFCKISNPKKKGGISSWVILQS